MGQEAKLINRATGISVHTVTGKRQNDNYSCGTDTFVFFRQALGRDAAGNFLIPNLLTSLKARATRKWGLKGIHYVSKLTDALLITAQTRTFVNENKETGKLANQIVHRGKTLEEIRKEHEIKIEPTKFRSQDVMNLCLYKKGIKFADTIEIQFYLNEVNNELKMDACLTLTALQQQEFRQEAKAELVRQGPVTNYCSKEGNYIKSTRPGLHDFAEYFLQQIKLNKSAPQKNHDVDQAPQIEANKNTASLILLLKKITDEYKNIRDKSEQKNIHSYFFRNAKYSNENLKTITDLKQQFLKILQAMPVTDMNNDEIKKMVAPSNDKSNPSLIDFHVTRNSIQALRQTNSRKYVDSLLANGPFNPHWRN